MRRALAVAMVLFGCPEPTTDPEPRADAGPVVDVGVDAETDAGADAAIPDAAIADAALADAAPPAPCRAIIDLGPVAADGFEYEGITADVSTVRGSCGGGGAEATLRWVPPTTGRWLLVAEAVVPRFDPLLHARSTCADPSTELACHDDLPDSETARIHVSVTAGEPSFVFVDATNRRGGFFRLRGAPIDEVVDGCDPRGLLNACAPGAFCSAAGACVGDAAPTMGPPTIRRHPGDVLSVEFEGADPSRDATGAALQVYAGGARLEVDPRGFDTWLLRPAEGIFDRAEFTFRFRSALLRNTPEADHVRLQLRDGQGNSSPWVLVPLIDAPIRGLGEGCDRSGFADACAPGSACRLSDKSARCAWLEGPVLDEVAAWASGEGVGVRVRARDPDRDTTQVTVRLLDADDREVDAVDGALRRRTWWGGRLSALRSWRTEVGGATQVEVRVTDRGGRESAPRIAPLVPAPERAPGAGCDSNRGFDACGQGHTCAGDPPACVPAVTECPAGWAVLDLHALDEGPTWRHFGDSSDAPDRARGSCGGGAGQVIYTFTAPGSGWYRFSAYSADSAADPVLTVRTHCGFPGTSHPEYEVGCNDDSGGRDSRLRRQLEEGAQVFVVVDGFSREPGTGWRGPYVLRVDRL